MRRLSKEDFISKCIEKHGDVYDYSLVEYVNTRTKVSIICRTHGIFNQLPKHHYIGQGCPRCYGNLNLSKDEFTKLSNHTNYDYILLPDTIKVRNTILVVDKNSGLVYQQFATHHLNGVRPTKLESKSLIKKLNEIHKNKYDYIIEKEIYNLTDKIKLIDRLTSDIFYYRVDRHLKGMKPNKITLNYFLIKSKEIHSNKYDYSLITDIRGGRSKVDIICKDHGIFKQMVSNHINLGDGCPKCVGKGKWNTENLKEEFIKIHLDRYDYSNVVFNGVNNKIEIICKEHGIFHQNIHKHLKGQGCPKCSFNSKGEEYIKGHLEEMKIKYIRQHGFDSCRYINKLNFDFYLPELNTCIEFDGIQHFKPVRDFGGLKEFKNIKKRDECKDKWCLKNNVNLIRIKYDQIDIIRKILENNLLKVK